MSYCRWGADSDVYVYRSRIATGTPGAGNRDCWICCACTISEADRDDLVYSREDMIAHLGRHRARGHAVPERALERLRAELAEP